MVITHHGGQCFKVTFGDLTLVFDPISKNGSLPAVRFGADIALVSRDHPDMNGIDEVTYGDPSNPLRAGKIPFAITGPGEYERGGVVIQGFLSHSGNFINTIYSVQLEDMTLVHLGALSDTELSQEARESIDEIDVLFVPIGGSSTELGAGNSVLTPAKAHELAVSLEPKIIVPMHWSGIGAPKSLEAFLKEAGVSNESTGGGSASGGKVDKLTLKKKDLTGLEGSIMVIQS